MKELREAARPYYSEELQYHNFSHVEDVLGAAEDLLDRAEEHELDIDEEAVKAAVFFHDAYYQKDEERFGFNTKEDLSKEVARIELRELGYDEKFIRKVEDCIEATKHHSLPDEDSPEEIVMRASDLRGLMADYDEFLENTYALRDEHETLHGEKQEYEEWMEGVLNVLDHYGTQKLELTPENETDQGLSEFHAELGKNRQQFIIDHIEPGTDINVKIN